MERTISPGVFTEQYDQTYLPSGVESIPATIIGPTAKGRAFVPTSVSTMAEYEKKFGPSDGYSYVPYAVQNYLINGNNVNVVKVLQNEGYIISCSIILAEASGGASGYTVGFFHPTNFSSSANVSASAITATPITDTFVLDIVTPSITTDFSSSIYPSNTNYIGKQFGYTPNETTDATYAKGAYNYLLFTQKLNDISGSNYSASIGFQVLNLSGSYGNYSNAYTPWVLSQYTNGTTSQRLFQFKTIGDGTNENQNIKVEITNIKFGSEVAGTDYGTFTVVVRDYSDNDKQQNVLESFDVNLDPTSDKFIAKVIGNKYATISTVETSQGSIRKVQWYGDYDNNSNYIYVSLDESVMNGVIDPSLVPFGFEPYYQPILTPAAFPLPTMPLNIEQTYNTLYTPLVSYGVNFANTDVSNYCKPIPSGATTGSNANFYLYQCNIHNDQAGTYAGQNIGIIATGSNGAYTNIPSTARKFKLAFQGGFDGMNPALIKKMGSDITATNTIGFNCSSLTAAGGVAYTKALSILQNADEYDTNLLIMPGIIKSLHPNITNKAVELVESRGDMFYIMDTSVLTASLTTAISDVSDLNTSFAGCYYPWLRTYDLTKKKYMWVPPSTLVLSAMSLNDRKGYEWYAPAGLNRGGISGATQAYTNLSRIERDDLYENRINAIASFPNEGIVAWGQKTLQVKPSALDRINVRRLMINLEKFIASSVKYLVFEQNVNATRNAFLAMVNPYMESIQQRSGIYAFKVVMDETLNTPDVIDRNELVGEIYLQPTRTVEFIRIGFFLTPTGATFG